MSGRRDAWARRVLAVTLGGACLAHAVGLAVHHALSEPTIRLAHRLAVIEPVAPPWSEPLAAAPSVVSLVALDAADVAALLAVPGPGDGAAFGAHPNPEASADLPGARAADRGGGAA